MFLHLLVVIGTTNHEEVVAGGGRGTFGMVLGKVRVPVGRTSMQNCVKRSRGQTYHLPGVVNHKLWRGQLRQLVPHTAVHSGRSPRVVVVAQEVDGLAVLPGDGTQTSPAPEFVSATFSQPPAEFLWVVLATWHDGADGQDS